MDFTVRQVNNLDLNKIFQQFNLTSQDIEVVKSTDLSQLNIPQEFQGQKFQIPVVITTEKRQQIKPK